MREKTVFFQNKVEKITALKCVFYFEKLLVRKRIKQPHAVGIYLIGRGHIYIYYILYISSALRA